MDRRELLKTGAAVAAASMVANPALAQAPKKVQLSAYSRTLHWLRKPEEVAAAIREIGNKSVDLTVRSGSGHVDPEKVKTDLPTFVKGLRAGGIEVSMIAPTITDATDANAEAVLDAASNLGIHHYWWGTYRYDETKPYWPQLDALKPKVAALAKLNEKYGMKAMAHPRNGSGSVSGSFFDLLYILKEFDPRWVSYQYDTGQLMQARADVWVSQIRLGAPYIGGFVWKDSVIEPINSPNPDDAFRAANPPAQQGPSDGAGVGAGRGGAAAGGRAGRGANPNADTPRWRSRQVPIGTGLVDVKLVCQALKDINFDGPMECEPEWPQLGGADQGATSLTISRDQCIALLRRDRVAVQTAMDAIGL
jgi:sugar phosphate isomerase/epimerase